MAQSGLSTGRGSCRQWLVRKGAAVQAQGSAAMQWLSQGSAQGGSGSAGLVWLGADEAGAAVRQEAGRENMK